MGGGDAQGRRAGTTSEGEQLLQDFIEVPQPRAIFTLNEFTQEHLFKQNFWYLWRAHPPVVSTLFKDVALMQPLI